MAALSGELTFARALEALAAARAALAEGEGPLVLDLGGVTRVDSSGLALLLELARQGKAAGREVQFKGAPEQLQRLADFFGLSELLALSA